jgi:hypothetical protein
MAEMGPGWSLSSGRAERGPGGRGDEKKRCQEFDAKTGDPDEDCRGQVDGGARHLVDGQRAELLIIKHVVGEPPAQLPVKRGRRFSRKAAAPSR